jgi:dynein heavy chain 1
VLSIAPDGIASFATARKLYDGQIERVEAELEDKIRELLTAAKDDANEMFRVCAKFNPLFVREKIKNAIREYQEQLIATVNKDINVLRTKLNVMSSVHISSAVFMLTYVGME